MELNDDKPTADADVAARFLMALLNRGVEHADAVSLTAAYMGSRAYMDEQKRIAGMATLGPTRQKFS
jgi:hypothetical protein